MNYFFAGLLFVVITNFGMDLSTSDSGDEKTVLSVSGQTSYKSIDSARSLTVADIEDSDYQVSISPQEAAEEMCSAFFDISPLPTDLRDLFGHRDQETYEQEIKLYIGNQLARDQALHKKISQIYAMQTPRIRTQEVDIEKALFTIAAKKVFFERETELQNEIKELRVRNKIIGLGCAGSHCVSILFAALISAGATFGLLAAQDTLE